MVIKINYTSSDVYVSTSVSPVYVVVNYSGTGGGGGGAVWGGITGTLSDQTDLQTALDGKFDDPTGTTSQYLRGDGSLATFPTIPSGTVTSVGLTMPSAFAVANSPITSSGTLAVTGAGTSAQYVRGDGQLANFPTNGGGGSSVNYYLNGSVSQGTFGGDTYYEMSKTPIIGAGTNFTRTNAQGNGYIASFITDAGDPALLNIPGGNWNLEFYFAASSSGSTPSFYAELYKVSSSNVFTLIASGSTNPEGITQGTVIDQYFTSIAVPQTSLLVTDRLAIRIFVTPSGRTITLHTEDNNLCEILTTFSTGLNALNGLTSQVQYFATGTSGTDFNIASATDTHTFNLPTASATNRGALSSSDWSTFSGKVGGSGVTGQVAYWNGTNSQTGSNNLFWDAANSVLGVGTNTPNTASVLHSNKSQNTLTSIFVTNNNAGTAAHVGFRAGLDPSNFATDYISLFILGANFTTSGLLKAKTGVVENFGSNLIISNYNNTEPISFTTGTSRVEKVRIIAASGNVILQNGGTFSDGGQRLQVYGDAFIKGSGSTSATNALLVQNSAGTQLLRVQNNGWLSFGPSASGPFISTQGAASGSLLFYNIGTVNADGAFIFRGDNAGATSGSNIAINISQQISPSSGSGNFSLLAVTSTINQTGGANGITRGLYVNPTLTAAADWRSIEWSNNSGWGLYGAGTANNFLGGNLTVSRNQNGGTNILVSNTTSGNSSAAFVRVTSSNGFFDFGKLSATTDPYRLNKPNDSVIYNAGSGDIGIFNDFPTGGIKFATGGSGTQIATFTAAGRLLLGLTAESTFLLDVNGTARVSGNVTISTGTTSQGTFIGASNQARYFSNAGVNTNAIYTSATATDQDVLAAYVSGGAISNLYLYVQSNGYIGTRSGIRLGAASGTDVLTQITNTWLNVAAGTTARSQINLASSTAPTSPNNGDIWFDGTDLKMRIGGVTKTFTLV